MFGCTRRSPNGRRCPASLPGRSQMVAFAKPGSNRPWRVTLRQTISSIAFVALVIAGLPTGAKTLRLRALNRPSSFGPPYTGGAGSNRYRRTRQTRTAVWWAMESQTRAMQARQQRSSVPTGRRFCSPSSTSNACIVVPDDNVVSARRSRNVRCCNGRDVCGLSLRMSRAKREVDVFDSEGNRRFGRG